MCPMKMEDGYMQPPFLLALDKKDKLEVGN